MAEYLCRICWNSSGWRFPTGEARKLEKGTYVHKYGFGHEEWLFNYSWKIGQYHYSFLQPVGRSHRRYEGELLDILLYTIGPGGARLLVGEIKNCEVLSETQAREAEGVYKKNGWLKAMVAQVKTVGGKEVTITEANSPLDILNVRFDPRRVTIFEPFRHPDKHDKVSLINRYTLVEAGPALVQQWRRSRKASQTPPEGRTVSRKGSPGNDYDPLHPQLQRAAYEILVAKYGKANVELERDFVDIRVKTPRGLVLIEIKTAAEARKAIREGAGQLLEYAYSEAQRTKWPSRLVVVAPAPAIPEVGEYLSELDRIFGLPLEYCEFNLGSKTLSI